MATSAADPAKQNRREITVNPSDNDLKQDMKEALQYLMVLKQHVDADQYRKFGEIMKHMMTDRILPSEGVKMVKNLLREHPDLFLGYLCFLPEDLDEIDPPPSETKPDYKDALAFICKLKRLFSENDEKYKSFVNLVKMHFTDCNKPADELYEEVVVLFQGHADLIQEFSNFMPNDTPTKVLFHDMSSMEPLGHGDGGRHSNTPTKVPSHDMSSMEPLGHGDGGRHSNTHGVGGSKDKGKEKVLD